MGVCLIATAVWRVTAEVEAFSTEYVLVQKVTDDQAIIIRSDGTAYLIEKGPARVVALNVWDTGSLDGLSRSVQSQ